MTVKSDNVLGNINEEFSLCLIFTECFNVGCSRWWNSDVTSLIGSEIGNLTSSLGYKQIIEKPTHIINNYLRVYILYFATIRTRFQSIVFLANVTILLYMVVLALEFPFHEITLVRCVITEEQL